MAGARTLVCGTGYTGEDGVELLIPPDHARAVWEALIEACRARGLRGEDTLRLEVNYCLYGNDLTEERTLIEAGLACVKEDTRFVGSGPVGGSASRGPKEVLEPFVTGSGSRARATRSSPAMRPWAR